ncbi:hypothetical protein Q0Z83_018230 [Actinoplanes sichuanensis]|nr:hypothetical protein Q0Z83_018230 [Actinoplanes sichuanensis]
MDEVQVRAEQAGSVQRRHLATTGVHGGEHPALSGGRDLSPRVVRGADGRTENGFCLGHAPSCGGRVIVTDDGADAGGAVGVEDRFGVRR